MGEMCQDAGKWANPICKKFRKQNSTEEAPTMAPTWADRDRGIVVADARGGSPQSGGGTGSLGVVVVLVIGVIVVLLGFYAKRKSDKKAAWKKRPERARGVDSEEG